jgi:hypothetical protein
VLGAYTSQLLAVNWLSTRARRESNQSGTKPALEWRERFCYGPTGNQFTGQGNWVQIDLGDDDHDHLITAEDKFNLAMARQ